MAPGWIGGPRRITGPCSEGSRRSPAGRGEADDRERESGLGRHSIFLTRWLEPLTVSLRRSTARLGMALDERAMVQGFPTLDTPEVHFAA